MCKVLEKIIRLRWFLEKYLSNTVSDRSTYNCLHDIQAEIYESFKRGHVLRNRRFGITRHCKNLRHYMAPSHITQTTKYIIQWKIVKLH